MRAHCPNCDTHYEQGDYIDLHLVTDLATKLQVGQEVPAGACAKCGSLVYESDDHERLNRASGILQRDYWQDVRGVASELEAQIESGEILSPDDLHDRAHEMVDGSQRIIYTHQAKLALLYTDNDQAGEDAGLEPGANIEAWAFYAMLQDVMDRVTEPDTCDECCTNYATTDDDLCAECAAEVTK
jgi:hypothetical protein